MSVSARFGVRWQGDAQAAFDEAVQHLGAAAAPKRIFDRMQTGPYAPLSVRIASAGLGSPYLRIAPCAAPAAPSDRGLEGRAL